MILSTSRNKYSLNTNRSALNKGYILGLYLPSVLSSEVKHPHWNTVHLHQRLIPVLLHSYNRRSSVNIYITLTVRTCKVYYITHRLVRSEHPLQNVLSRKPNLYQSTLINWLFNEQLKLNLSFILKRWGLTVILTKLLPVLSQNRVFLRLELLLQGYSAHFNLFLLVPFMVYSDIPIWRRMTHFLFPVSH